MILFRGSHVDRGLFVMVVDTSGKEPSRWLPPLAAARALHCLPAFATGYSGAGTHCLAMALLLEVTGNESTALRLHRSFANVFLYRIPTGNRWTIERAGIETWLAERAEPAFAPTIVLRSGA